MSDSAGAELNLVLKAERPEGFDLEEFAHTELETAKDALREEGFLAAVAWVITSTEIHLFSIGFDNAQQKEQVYSELVERAKGMSAEAIMMLNDTRYLPDMDTFYKQRGSFDGAKEAICVYISGPKIKTKELTAKYERVGERIVFSPTEEEDGTTLNILGSWSKELREIQ